MTNNEETVAPQDEIITEEEATEETQEAESTDDSSDRIKELEAEVGKYKRLLSKESKKDKEEEKPVEVKSGDIDYGQLAFHNSKSGTIKIESEEEVEFLKKQMEETGKSQATLLNANWFKKELEELKENKASSEAIPKTSSRSRTVSPKHTVDYWLAKGELPPDTPENTELRRQVLNKEIENEERKSRFSKQSVIIA